MHPPIPPPLNPPLVIITDEMPVPVTILYAYLPNPRHIRKDVLIRRIIASRLCTAGGQQFRKEKQKL